MKRHYLRHQDISVRFALVCERCQKYSEVSWMMGEEGRRAVSCRFCGTMYLTFIDRDGKQDLVIFEPPPFRSRILN